jgi:sigma-54-specific transcriptional regulator
VVPIPLAALRERPGDILPLVEHFISIYKGRLHTKEPELHPDTVRLLHEYPWPDNIRELENTIHRALLVCDGNILRPANLNLPITLPKNTFQDCLDSTDKASEEMCMPEQIFSQFFDQGHDELHELVQRKLVLQAYDHSHQSQVQAAKQLGISRNELRTQIGCLTAKNVKNTITH